MKNKLIWTSAALAIYVSICWCVAALGELIGKYFGDAGLLIMSVILFCVAVWYMAGNVTVTVTKKDEEQK